MKKKMLIILAVAAAVAIGVWFFFFRRRISAEVSGATLYQTPPSPQAALAQLGTSVTSAITQKVQGVAYRALDTVGTAVVANLPQSTPRPTASANPYTGLATIASDAAKLPFIGLNFKALASASQKASATYDYSDR